MRPAAGTTSHTFRNLAFLALTLLAMGWLMVSFSNRDPSLDSVLYGEKNYLEHPRKDQPDRPGQWTRLEWRHWRLTFTAPSLWDDQTPSGLSRESEELLADYVHLLWRFKTTLKIVGTQVEAPAGQLAASPEAPDTRSRVNRLGNYLVEQLHCPDRKVGAVLESRLVFARESRAGNQMAIEVIGE